MTKRGGLILRVIPLDDISLQESDLKTFRFSLLPKNMIHYGGFGNKLLGVEKTLNNVGPSETLLRHIKHNLC